jgi:hypothetical protein
MIFYRVSMGSIRPHKVGLVLATLFGGIHFLWALLVASGWAQAYIDFIFHLHFIKLDLVIEPFNVGTALLLVSITAFIGYMLGWGFAMLWKHFHGEG